MNWICRTHCIWAVLVFLNVIPFSTACWDSKSPGYGETTPDYDLPVGSDLIVNCTLKAGTLPEVTIPVNSSYLAFKRDGDSQVYSTNTHQMDDLTAQLRIPNAKVTDSGMYHCQILLPDTSKHVCSTNVYVGYPPKNVSNFKCISRNFDNLTCTWDVEPNRVRTDYSVQKIFLFQDTLQNCPKPNNNTFCQWRDDTEPPYQTMNKNLTFVVHGNNSLGYIENEFKFDHFAIVMPNEPEELKATDISKQSITIQWQSPAMTRILDKPALFYQLRLEELGPGLKDITVVEAGVETFNYTFEGLIPHFLYNLSVRCRSNHTTRDEMWSPFTSIVRKTLADVPYILPEVNSEAFLMHNFGNYRNTTLYWKPVSERFYNGEDFHYRIVYFPVKTQDNTNSDFVQSKTPFVKIGHLRNDSAYLFHIYSANNEGISDDFKTIFIDERNKIAPPPKDIRAISHELGYYNLSWSNGGYSIGVNYTVFWCAGRKPSYCDGPIQWSDEILRQRKFSLDVSNVNYNFQFAVSATYGNRSSGMQWASCIVPRKAPLGQIPITHMEPTSTTLRIIWKLDCEAQKSVIDRYVITYCRAGKDCKDAVAKADVQSYTLNYLHPFSNYSVKLTAFNKENKPSEDTDEMYQSTLSGGPSGPPRNVSLVSKNESSFSVRWLPPIEPNGIITDYYIYHNGLKHHMKDGTSCNICEYRVQGLREFTVYNVSIEACVRVYCSRRSEPIEVLTDVGVPGRMDPPRTEMVNETHLKVSWTSPFLPNGPIDFFEIQWQEEMGNETMNKTVAHNQMLSTYVEFKCSNLLEGGLTYQFYVRAANMKNGMALYGPLSDPTKATACIMSQGLAMIIGVAIGGTLVLAIFLLVLYKLVKWMSEKIHQVKNIAVRLPKELEGPEANPLNNYESFKNGLAQSVLNGKVDHLSYAIDESDNKNRHGSGSSQFSNSSSDELIFKNGKCTKFGRKPSGDSSGCSSMSSNTTTRMHLSSDSGTECDFMVPASPDSVSNEQSVFGGLKPHMPILMEIHDSIEPVSETQVKTGIDSQLEKYNNFISGMVLKVDQPYSKFGISGNVSSSVPCQINPLAFYSCNLANSEPSVFEAQASNKQKPSVMPPYSKMGLAKSSGDILGINARSKEMGYSKFGFDAPLQCLSIDIEKTNPIVGMALVEDTIHQEQFLPKAIWDNKETIGVKANPPRLSHLADIQHSDKGVLSDCKKNKSSSVSNRPSSGYVQVGDIRGMKEVEDMSSSTSSLEEDNLPLKIPEDLPGDLSDISTVWTTGLFQLPPEEGVDVLDFNNTSFNKHSTDHQPNGLITSSSPSTGCLHVVPSSGVCATESDSGTPINENQFNFSNPRDILPEGDVVSCLNSTGSNGQVLARRSPSSLKKRNQSPEVLLTLGGGMNGYVPFSTLSSSVCDQPVSVVPNATESNVPLSVFPGDNCIDVDQNYVTPSNKGELKLLQEGVVSNSKPFSPLLHCNGNKMHKISAPLKYILKPMPKMESEICEV